MYKLLCCFSEILTVALLMAVIPSCAYTIATATESQKDWDTVHERSSYVNDQYARNTPHVFILSDRNSICLAHEDDSSIGEYANHPKEILATIIKAK